MAPRSGPALLRWAIRAAALGGVPLLLSGAVLLVQRDPSRYGALLREDGPVEWLTFAFLILAALAAFITRAGTYRPSSSRFLLVAGVLCFVAALEEISWGQRLLRVPTPAFFVEHSDQPEINAHNVLQRSTGMKSKHVVGGGFAIYGVLLPLVCLGSPGRLVFQRLGVEVPDAFLAPTFAAGSLMMLDLPSGFEEELGEMITAFGLFLFLADVALAGRRAVSR